MSSTKVKKLPLMSDEPYEYDYDQEIPDKLQTQQNMMWLADILLHKEFESLEYHGVENVPDNGPFIICSNHANGFDPITIGFGMKDKKRELWFMSKSEFFQAFYTRWLLNKFAGFPVHRDSADTKAIYFSKRLMEAGKGLVVFVQGTRDRFRLRPEPETAYAGAMMVAREAKVPVLPVSVHLDPDLDNHHPGCVIRYGELIPYEELGFTEGKRRPKELRRAMDLVMNKIGELWDLDTEKFE